MTRRGKTVHKIRDNSILSELLGKRWAVRTKNEMGDFEAVRNGTLEYRLHRRPPVNDFDPIGGKFFPSKLEQNPLLVLTFVWDTGNLRQYKELFQL